MRRLVFLLALGGSLGLAAQEDQQWVVAHLAYDRFSKASGLTSQQGLGFGAGFWVTELVGLEVRGIYMPEKAESGHRSKEVHGLVSFLYSFRPDADNWNPYLAAGFGITRTGRGNSTDAACYTGRLESAFTSHAGLGVMGHLSEHTLIQGDVKLMRVDLPRPVTRNELLCTFGVGYTWGGEKSFRIIRNPGPYWPPEPNH